MDEDVSAANLPSISEDGLDRENEHTSSSALSESSLGIKSGEDEGTYGGVGPTSKTESEKLERNILDVFEQLERECGEESCKSDIDMSQVMKILSEDDDESRGIDSNRNANVPDIIALLEMYQNLEELNNAHKSKMEQQQNENLKLKLDLTTIREKQKRDGKCQFQKIKSLESQVASLEADLQSETLKKQKTTEQVSSLLKELDACRVDSLSKSQQIIGLSKEITALKKEATKRVPTANPYAPAKKASTSTSDFQEVEAEYQKKIRQLEKQVRNLQKIKFGPEKWAPLTRNMKAIVGDVDDSGENEQEHMLESENAKELESLRSKVAELEKSLAASDSARKLAINESQSQLSKLKENERLNQKKYIDEIASLKSEIEKLVADREFLDHTDWAKENEHLKQELENKSKQIVRLSSELARFRAVARPKPPPGSNSIDSSAEALFKEKEIEFKKKERKLQAQVRSLQQILFKKDPNRFANTQQVAEKPYLNSNSSEKEKILEDRIAELEKQLRDQRRSENECVRTGNKESNDNYVETAKLHDLRSRLVSQMNVVSCLKEHLTEAKTQISGLAKEKGILEFRIRQLSQELALAKTMSKPENQVLAELAETVQNLSSRYFYREKELDNLISRLSFKHLIDSSIPVGTRRILGENEQYGGIPKSICSGSSTIPTSDAFLDLTLDNAKTKVTKGIPDRDLQAFSPTTVLHLLGESVDDLLVKKT